MRCVQSLGAAVMHTHKIIIWQISFPFSSLARIDDSINGCRRSIQISPVGLYYLDIRAKNRKNHLRLCMLIILLEIIKSL